MAIKIDGDVVTMNRADYEDLADDAFFLNCLQNAGVDNWCGYDDAREYYQAGQDED